MVTGGNLVFLDGTGVTNFATTTGIDFSAANLAAAKMFIDYKRSGSGMSIIAYWSNGPTGTQQAFTEIITPSSPYSMILEKLNQVKSLTTTNPTSGTIVVNLFNGEITYY